jgi:nucleoside-diphosphate-sugar epimerase
MRIAVTGGTGFLGRYIIDRLAADGHDLRGWRRAPSRADGIDASVEWMPGRLGSRDDADKLVDGVDAVVHAALEWPGRRGDNSSGDLLDFAQTNLMGSLMLMHAARLAGVKRFIFISTCAVHDRILDDRPLDEAHPLWPHGHYGAHKAAIEKFVHSTGMGKGWPVCSLRPTGIYGLMHTIERSKWYGLVRRVVAGESIAEPKGGKEVHAADVARAVALLLTCPEDAMRGEAFNCYDLYIADQRVAELARDICGVKSAIESLIKGPKHQIETGKIRALGMAFGGEPLLRETIQAMINHIQRS